jgi:hypothetical protein
VNDADQFPGARGATFAFRLHHLTADVIFDNLNSKAGRSASGGLLEQLNAWHVLLKNRPLQGVRSARSDQVFLPA